MKKIMLLLMLGVSSFTLEAQFKASSIATGRPGQAIGIRTIGKGVLQIQSGITYQNVSQKDTKTGSERINPSIVIRYGFWERIELSGVLGYNRVQNITIDEIYTQGGINTTQLGIRFNVSQNKGAQPGVCFQYRLLLPLQSKAFKKPYLGSRLIVATSNKLTERLGFGTNWSMTLDGSSPQPLFGYVLNLSCGLTDKIGTFIEMYGSINDTIDTNFDTGFSYLVKKDLQLDISAGWEGSNKVSNYFVDLGVSWRFHDREE